MRASRERWLASENEIRYTFNVAHITDEFRKQEYLNHDDWQILTEKLNQCGYPTTISYPPDDNELIIHDQNFFKPRQPRPEAVVRSTFTKPMALRVAADGTTLFTDAEDALRININCLPDSPHFFRSLLRQAQARTDLVTI